MNDKLVKLNIPFAPVAFNAKNQTHLVYEMFIHNESKQELNLKGIKTTSPDLADVTIQKLEGKGIEENIRYLNNVYRPAEEQNLGMGNVACVFFWLSFDPSEVPQDLQHEIAYEDEKGNEYTACQDLAVQKKIPLTIEAPLRGEGWLAGNGASNNTGHRRTPLFIDDAPYFAQRYAMDWLQFGPDGKLFRDTPEKNENWYCYGADLHAVADGVVVEIQDGIIENVPLSETMAVEINLQSSPGNLVLLDLGEDNYALYAHMLPGSLLVKAGDKVKSGQLIGKLGNSGNSGAPHLHFHIGHRNSPLGTHGLPFHVRQFEWAGNAGSTEEMMEIVEKGRSWVGEDTTVQRSMELILDNDVINF